MKTELLIFLYISILKKIYKNKNVKQIAYFYNIVNIKLIFHK